MDQLIKKEPKKELKKFQNFGKLVNLENIKKVEEFEMCVCPYKMG